MVSGGGETLHEKGGSHGEGNVVTVEKSSQSGKGLDSGRVEKQVAEDVLRPVMNGAEGVLQVAEL